MAKVKTTKTRTGMRLKITAGKGEDLRDVPLVRALMDLVRCQFCGKSSPRKKWVKDACPKCGGVYDAMLAQEGDD